MTAEHNSDKIREVLSQNSLRGETYYVKFKSDPTFYLGIPMLRSSFQNGDENIFTINILEPTTKSGVFNRLVKEIEFLEPK